MSKYTKEKLIIPKTIKPKERVKIAKVVIEHIITRSANGLDKNNKKFPKYSFEYADKKGVGVSDVDLILTGEMLDELELVSHKAGEIVIGYKNPSDELAGKVEGNRIGSYGREPNKKKARDFLGLPKDELEVLAAAFEEDIDLDTPETFTKEEITTQADDGGFDTESILDRLLMEVFGDS